MKKEELKEKLPLFLLEQIEDEKAQNTLKKYSRNIESFLEWLPDGAEVEKAIVIEYKAYLLNEKHFRTNTIRNNTVRSEIAASDYITCSGC